MKSEVLCFGDWTPNSVGRINNFIINNVSAGRQTSEAATAQRGGRFLTP